MYYKAHNIFLPFFNVYRLIRLSSPNLNFIIAIGSIVFVGSVFFFSYPPLNHQVLNVFCWVSERDKVCCVWDLPGEN